MNNEIFYKDLETRCEKAWTKYEDTHKKITAQTYFSNTSLPGIPELHKLIEDTNLSFNMLFNLLKIKTPFNQETQASILNALESLEGVSSQMETIFNISIQSGKQDSAYKLQDYIY